MILVVTGTGGKATKYAPIFEQLASWGFIVIGTQDKGTGKGETTIKTLNYMLVENENKSSIFYEKIDVENIGITGFSQGGTATLQVMKKRQKRLLSAGNYPPTIYIKMSKQTLIEK